MKRDGIREIFLQSIIHGLLTRTDASRSADIIYMYLNDIAASKARYSLTVLKVPLNPNESIYYRSFAAHAQ